jgi:hypothetical protein
MKTVKKNENNLVCQKTGSKAEIISYFEEDNISYAKISIKMKFEEFILSNFKNY